MITIERPADHCGPWRLFALKVDHFSVPIISNNVNYFEKILFTMNVSLGSSLQKLFSTKNSKMAPK